MQTNVIRVRELTVKYQMRRVQLTDSIDVGVTLNTPAGANALLMHILQDEPSEVFAILCLDMKFRLVAYHEVSRGTIDATYAHPREVFRAALLANAANLILAHNHPSGDPEPSALDFQLTSRLVEAGQVLGIRIHDHVIVGDGRYFSFKEAGRL